MGAYWLHDAPAALSDAGLNVHLWPGWATRSRSTGGFDNILAVVAHHTAGPANQDTFSAAQFHYEASPVRPVGNITLGRDGLVIFGAAGATNTQGAGGPTVLSKGTIPLDQGNRYGIAIEACNNGIGEVWPEAQLDAYRRCCAVLCDLYGLDPLRDVIAHYEYAPNRKIDPAGGTGQSPYAILTDRYLRWDMPRFRNDVHAIMDTVKITNPVRILDTREGTAHNGHVGAIPTGGQIKVRPHGFTPSNVEGVILSLTGVANVYGFFTIYSGDSDRPVASSLSLTPGVNTNNLVFVPLASDRTFTVYAGGAPGANNLIIDQVGWY